MRILKPAFRIEDANNVLRSIETGGRVCYKSEDKMRPGSDVELIDKLKSFKHESVLEHGVITISFTMDRGVSHEIVRHRHLSPSQESTRYCNYSKGKFNNEISVIDPAFFSPDDPDMKAVSVPYVSADSMGSVMLNTGEQVQMNAFDVWLISCLWAEWAYMTLTEKFGRSAQEARSVLPNSLKTSIQITANVREWRHVLSLRTHRDAHPQMRQIMVPLGHALARRWPCLFDEFTVHYHDDPARELQPDEDHPK